MTYLCESLAIKKKKKSQESQVVGTVLLSTVFGFLSLSLWLSHERVRALLDRICFGENTPPPPPAPPQPLRQLTLLTCSIFSQTAHPEISATDRCLKEVSVLWSVALRLLTFSGVSQSHFISYCQVGKINK